MLFSRGRNQEISFSSKPSNSKRWLQVATGPVKKYHTFHIFPVVDEWVGAVRYLYDER